MPQTFARVSIYWQDQQLDVSLPTSRPVIDFIDDVVQLIGAEGDNWALSLPAAGVLEPLQTLDEAAVFDGARLYLTARADAAKAPFVDDVMAEVRQTVGQAHAAWAGQTRSIGLLTAVVSLAVLVAGVLSFGAFQPATTGLISMVGLIVVALGAAGLSVWSPRVRYVAYLIPVIATVVAAAGGGPVLVAASASIIPAAWLGSRSTALMTAATICTLVFGVVSLALFFGASLLAIAAWGAWVPVLALLVMSTVVVSATGLSAMLRRSDEGESISREDIRRRALRAERLARGVAWAATILAGACIVVLTTGPYWQQWLIAFGLSVILLLRTNGFADTRVIVPLLVVGVAGLALTANAVVPWSGAGVVILAICALLLLVGREPDALTQARLAKTINVIDTVACLAFIPLVLIGQGVYEYYWATT